MFSSLFGKSGSDKADKLRQQAIDAFNSIKTPELSQLQVQLDKYVQAGQLTPEQAESQLLTSNAFNEITTDPSLKGAQKQALQQMQQIATQGGMTAIDKAQLQDITDQQTQEANSRNAAVLSNTRERGIGGAGTETAARLMNEQAAADRASRAGTDVAANAQARALQALQAGATQSNTMESQDYGEAANKANSQNAIDLFNKQTQNATNLENIRNANAAQAANLSNAQSVSNANTSTSNANKEYNAQQVQQQYQDELNKANGVAGTFNNWANDANAAAAKDKAADVGITSGLLSTGATALGTAFGGPVGGMAAGAAVNSAKPTSEADLPGGGGYNPKAYTDENQFSNGGEVHSSNVNKAMGFDEAEPENQGSIEEEYAKFMKRFAYGGTVRMADGGMVNIKPGKQPANPNTLNPDVTSAFRQGFSNSAPKSLPILPNNNGTWDVKDTTGQTIGNFPNYGDAAVYADKVQQGAAQPGQYAKGGEIGSASSSQITNMLPINWNPEENRWVLHDNTGKRIGVFQTYAEAEQAAERMGHCEGGPIHDFRTGGKVPGIAPVSGDSPKNDIVPAMVSPGEVVVPRSIAQTTKDPLISALKKLKNPKRG